MSENTVNISDKEIEKIHAQISKLMADTAKVNKDMRSYDISKLRADTAKLNKSMRWYEPLIVSAAILAILAIAKHFL